MINLNQQKQLITKAILLREVGDLDIYRRYITEEVQLGKVIKSPLRKENNASFGFFMGESGELCFRDFLLGSGDCIKFVQLKFGLTFYEALSKIAIDFDLQDDYIVKSFAKTPQNDTNHTMSREDIINQSKPLKLAKKARNWQVHDIMFWESYGITKRTLDFFNVQPIEYYFINDVIIRADKYAYCFIELKDNIETYKFYQPFNKHYKWINGNDNSVWAGWSQLPEKASDLIITKSLKDVMAIYDLTGIPAVSLQSETALPKRHVFQQLEERFGTIQLLYDNDFDSEQNWGRIFADKLSKELGLVDCYIADKYKCKDFSDTVKMYGRERAKEILLKETLVPF